MSEMATFLASRPLIGMIHLPALPGSPRAELDLDRLVAFALDEAAILEGAGLDGAIVENVGDAPFFREHVPPITTAAMAVIVREVRRATSMKIGVNILRNACEEALAIASVTGADFIRCNVVIGAYVTDQGIIQGCAAELARLRVSLDRDIAVLGDVHVKHSAPLFDVPIEDAAADLAERGGADVVIVSGARSPRSAQLRARQVGARRDQQTRLHRQRRRPRQHQGLLRPIGRRPHRRSRLQSRPALGRRELSARLCRGRPTGSRLTRRSPPGA